MFDASTIPILALFFTANSAIGFVLWRIIDRIDVAKKDALLAADVAKKESLVAANAAAAEGKLAQSQLAEFREKVAQIYATKQGVNEATERLMGAIDKLGDRVENRLEGVTQRLDSVIAGRGHAD